MTKYNPVNLRKYRSWSFIKKLDVLAITNYNIITTHKLADAALNQKECVMTTVEKIQSAIDALSPEEYNLLRQWFLNEIGSSGISRLNKM